MRLLVTGVSGLLGLNLALQASQPGEGGRPAWDVTGLVYRRSLKGTPFSTRRADLSRPEEIGAILDEFNPQAVVHCAAMALLDECEAEPERAWQVNVDLPARLAEATHRRKIHLLHISSDSVFDGLRGGYCEDDVPQPVSVYARSKLAAEQAVAGLNPDALIVRTNFFGWSLSGMRSLSEYFVSHLSAGQKVPGWTDVVYCPLLVNDLSEILLEMLTRKLTGLYHVFSRGSLTKYEFGVRIADLFGLDANLIIPATLQDSHLRAQRSNDLRMCIDKVTAALGHWMPTPEQGLIRFYQLFCAGYPAWLRSFAHEVIMEDGWK